MDNLAIPPGHNRVMPYLVLQDAQNFSLFMQKVFGATETYKAMRDETRIAHAELTIADSTIMFGSSNDGSITQNAGMFIYAANPDETYEKAIVNGATTLTPMGDQSYGRSGGVTDPFGNVWWITGVK
jgi:PhnB protein